MRRSTVIALDRVWQIDQEIRATAVPAKVGPEEAIRRIQATATLIRERKRVLRGIGDRVSVPGVAL